jgi:hypothetical protein
MIQLEPSLCCTTPGFLRQRRCKFYLRGECIYGDACRYDHVRPEWGAANVNGTGASSSRAAPAAATTSRAATAHRIAGSVAQLENPWQNRAGAASAATQPANASQAAAPPNAAATSRLSPGTAAWTPAAGSAVGIQQQAAHATAQVRIWRAMCMCVCVGGGHVAHAAS